MAVGWFYGILKKDNLGTYCLQIEGLRMICLQGKSFLEDIAIGPIRVYGGAGQKIACRVCEDFRRELVRYELAKAKVLESLQELYEQAALEIGETHAAIFLGHRAILEDASLDEAVRNLILHEHWNAEFAVFATGENMSRMFQNIEDPYIRERSSDVRDIAQRLLDELMPKKEEEVWEEPSILVAKEWTPSETVRLEKEKVLAFVAEVGSKNSHVSILARSRNIPVIAGITPDESWEGRLAIVDGLKGRLFIDPDEATLEKFRRRKRRILEKRELLLACRDRETVTKDGKRIHLYGNMEDFQDVESILENGAEGIGLYRTEFLYLEREDFPTEEEQFEAYCHAAKKMGDRKVIIRTMDLGADKHLQSLAMEQEANSALGFRGIRICLERKDLFKTQLRAILRAAAFGNVAVMFPMIVSLQEVEEAKAVLEEAKEELEQEGKEFGQVEVGVMIETPAAVMLSDELTELVDFFSIGTNDLTQYTLAADRQNPHLEKMWDDHHPAVLKMIAMTAAAAKRGGIPVSVCGELGGDLSLTEELIRQGIDGFSVIPWKIPEVRQRISEIDGRK